MPERTFNPKPINSLIQGLIAGKQYQTAAKRQKELDLLKRLETYQKLGYQPKDLEGIIERNDMGEWEKIPKMSPFQKSFQQGAGTAAGKRLVEGDKKKEPTVPTSMVDFELTTFGKLVPEQRGTPEYVDARMKYLRRTKEQSPYVEALNKRFGMETKKAVGSLRKEFNNLQVIKDFEQINQRLGIMREALIESRETDSFVATDQAIITTFNKITDPQSVVRESEYARTQEDLGLISKAKAVVSRIAKGGRLTDSERIAIIRMAGRFKTATEKLYRERFNEYSSYIAQWEVDPNKYIRSVVPPVSDKFQVGRSYTDSAGRNAVYLGDGQWLVQ